MSNIQQFLEEEYKQVVTDFSKETLYETIEKHDTRLINAVLEEVSREWFKAKAETFSGQNEAESSIETIINNLRVK